MQIFSVVTMSLGASPQLEDWSTGAIQCGRHKAPAQTLAQTRFFSLWHGPASVAPGRAGFRQKTNGYNTLCNFRNVYLEDYHAH